MESSLYDQLLYDYYGELLTAKQQTVLHYYYEDNLTLSEIAEIMNTSRQAVHDTIKRSHKMLEKYEEILELISVDERRNQILIEARDKVQESWRESGDRRLKDVLDLLAQLV